MSVIEGRMNTALEVTGRYIGTLASPKKAIHPVRARQIGLSVVGGFLGLLALPPAFCFLLGVCFWFVPSSVEKRRQIRQRRHFESELALFVCVLEISLSAGSSITRAFQDAAESVGGALGEWAKTIAAGIEIGISTSTAFAWPHHGGECVDRLVDALQLGSVTGAPINEALKSIREQSLADERAAMLEWSRKCPVYLLFPLVFCILPAFVLLSIAPIFVSELSQLSKLFVS